MGRHGHGHWPWAWHRHMGRAHGRLPIEASAIIHQGIDHLPYWSGPCHVRAWHDHMMGGGEEMRRLGQEVGIEKPSKPKAT